MVIKYSRLVRKGDMSDNNKVFLQRVHFLNSLDKSVAANKINDMFLNEKTQKKMFFPNIFMNSDEFKDLGTLHYERRNQLDHYPLEQQESIKRAMGGTGSDFFSQTYAGAPPVKKWK